MRAAKNCSSFFFEENMIEDSLRYKIFDYIKNKYKTEPEYLWRRYPRYAVFRHFSNRKWFCIVMNVSGRKLGLPTDENIEVVNIKVENASELYTQNGFLRAYHMNKNLWVTVLLNGCVKFETICDLIELSYINTK